MQFLNGLFSVIVKLTVVQYSQVRINVQLSNKIHDLSTTNNMKSENFCKESRVSSSQFLRFQFTSINFLKSKVVKLAEIGQKPNQERADIIIVSLVCIMPNIY